MSTRPCVEIKKAHQDNLEAEIRGIHLRSAQVLAQQGLTDQQLELLIIILPDMSGFYGKLFKRIFKLIEDSLTFLINLFFQIKVLIA